MAATPDHIGRYRVRELLGAGGFATVYRATDERLEVDVAVKVLAENHSTVPEVRERFIEEGRRLRRVQGADLLAVYDLGETDRAQPYLVLAWADRGDLAARVRDRRPQGWVPTAVDGLAVARVLARALGDLHRHQLVHRDLTPRNLLLCSRGPTSPDPPRKTTSGRPPALLVDDEDLLLADLGMSKDLARASGLTVAGGTSGFAPPEQREPGRLVDGRADIWASSALLVWLALDAPPDDAGDWSEQLGARAPGWPPAVAAVLARGLAVDPEDRPATVGEWLADLEVAFHPPPVAATADTVALSGAVEAAAHRPRWRRRVGVALLAVAVLLVGGSAGWVLRGSTASGGDAVVAIDGPEQVVAGEEVVLTAAVEGAASWMWVAPDGSFRSGEELSFQPVSTGRVTVRVAAVDGAGQVTLTDHDIQVTE